MPRTSEEKDNILVLTCSTLFLPAAEGEEVPAPVVILQNDPANVYGVLERHVNPDCLPQPDKFWKMVRNTRAVPFETWRPRVNGSQLKMLQHARLPHGEAEWTAVGEAVSSLAPYLQPDSTPEALLGDLHLLCISVEQWWVNRRRTEGPASATATKRTATTQNYPQQPNGKRHALEGMQNGVLMNSVAQMPSSQGFLSLQNTSAFLPDIGGGGGGNNGGNGMSGMMPPMFSLNVPEPRVMSDPISRGSPRVSGGVPAAAAAHPIANSAAASAVKTVVILNVGGVTFSTTVATLASVEGSYLWKLSSKATSAGVKEFFLDRSGHLFHHVLDFLRCQRYNEGYNSLPEGVENLQLLRREAAFYRLPGLERLALEALAKAGGEVCDAVYVQTGFVEEGDVLEDAHSHLLLRLNAKLAAKQDVGFLVAHRHSGTEIRGMQRNIFYQVFLTKQR